MRKTMVGVMALLALFAVACVTINVYFPEAAAVEAADRIIDKVRGEQSKDDTTSSVRPSRDRGAPLLARVGAGIGGFLISDARAQSPVDFDKPSPEKQALEDALADRFRELRPYFDSGAIGHTDSGLIDFRDRGRVPLKERNRVVQLVAAQNNDWNALFAEIARLNGHPEWQDSIRRTFAERWVAKADAGWYYRKDGEWQQK